MWEEWMQEGLLSGVRYMSELKDRNRMTLSKVEQQSMGICK